MSKLKSKYIIITSFIFIFLLLITASFSNAEKSHEEQNTDQNDYVCSLKTPESTKEIIDESIRNCSGEKTDPIIQKKKNTEKSLIN